MDYEKNLGQMSEVKSDILVGLLIGILWYQELNYEL